MGIENLAAFFFAAIALIAVPGIDTFYILNRSITHGRKTGIYSAVGISCGIFVHTSLAAFGLSAIIATSALLYSIIKYAGAAYLIYLGIRAFFKKSSFDLGQTEIQSTEISKWKVFKKGILVNVLNPKVALFFFSFLPQFVNPAYSNTILSFYLLGSLFFIMGLIWCLFLAVSAAGVSSYMKKNERVQNVVQKCSGLIFMAFGIKVALEHR